MTDKEEIESLEEIEIEERIDLDKDPIVNLFKQHVRAGLLAFANTNISSEDAYKRYKHLLTIAHKFLKYSKDPNTSPETDFDKSIKEIVDFLLKRKRRIKVRISI